METDKGLCEKARKLGREFVVQVEGKVIERSSKNKNMPTGEVEIEVTSLNVLNEAKTPPFTIEDETDGGDEFSLNSASDGIVDTPKLLTLLFASLVMFSCGTWRLLF